MKNRGAIVAQTLQKLGITQSGLALRMGRSRRTLHNWLHDPELSWEKIDLLGQATHHNFRTEFPEMCSIVQVPDDTTSWRQEATHWQLKYEKLMEDYCLLLEKLATENLDSHKNVSQMLPNESDKH